jgi:precorrin-2 dehydrogenase / sirohydrochlorin ferrochelatase
MILFPMMLKLDGRRCVVVGAGKVAAAKIKGLLACGAQVTVVSPKAESSIRAQADAGKLTWRRRLFSPRDVAGAFLVIAATDSSAINVNVFRSCQARRVLCNSVDDPLHCDFFYPAVVSRGPLQIAISTGGRSPALAARLRKELERQFGPEWGKFVEEVGKWRQEILKGPPSAVRRKLLKRIAIPSESKAKKSKRENW